MPASALQKAPPSPTVPAGGLSNYDFSKQHYDWENELESMDQTQASLSLMQWKLVRNQTGMLAQQVMDVKKQVEDITKVTELLATRQDDTVNDNRTFEANVKEFVGKLFENMDANHTGLKESFQKSVEKNDRRHADNLKRVNDLHDNHTQILSAHGRVDDELQRLRNDLARHQQQASSHQHQMNQLQVQAAEATTAVQSMMEENRGFHEKIDDDIRARSVAHDETLRSCRELVDKDKHDRERHREHVLKVVKDVQSDLAATKEELSQLQGKLGTVAQLQAQIAEHPKSISAIESRLDELQTNIDKESAARNTLAEVFEHMLKTERTKLLNLITQRAAHAKLENDESRKHLKERLDKVFCDFETQLSAIHAKHAQEKTFFNERMSVVESTSRTNEKKFGALTSELRDLESRYRKLENQASLQARDLLRDVQAMVTDERTPRESAQAEFEMQLGFLGETHDKLRGLFREKSEQPKRLLSPRSSPRQDSPWTQKVPVA
mmetsp:Transcript_47233/g.131891  ORF Transcript_47233/g.131891 Transcript_47233/m.131891 type:complete len:495 (+) Transcript_47233:79-1563(+)